MTGASVSGGEGHQSMLLDRGWELASLRPSAASRPAELAALCPEWHAAPVLGTAAAMLRALGRFDLDGSERRFDAEDFWYRCRLPVLHAAPGEQLVLCFDGLATVADAWLDDTPILSCSDMFVAHAIDVSSELGTERVLWLRFQALDALLRARRPRPRWRAPMIEHQQLRWYRTTLLGRTPGWSPPAAPVGPWRPIRIERRRGVAVHESRLRTSVEGAAGRLQLSLELRLLDGRPWHSARVRVEGGASSVECDAVLLAAAAGCQQLTADVFVPAVELWWPHTHGSQPRYAVRVIGRSAADGAEQSLELGRVGFRTLELTAPATGNDFRLSINGAAVFWRGACWTPLDVVALNAPEPVYRQALSQVRDAGMNMLRVVGSMTYEADVFYDLCDELGIALWHDLMFANMDYPEDDAFVGVVRTEVAQTLRRFAGRPSLALVCGDTEGEQQAAMWGCPRQGWVRPLFQRTLPRWCAELLPDVPYWPSSSSGKGAYPHQPNAGPTSYYGVGAYLRPLEDARRAEVRFASECLAFANVPDTRTLEALGGDRPLHAHSPRWKQRSPRDLGAGWDFDDVRDHYLRVLFGHDPLTLRYADHERYLALSRVTSGEVMANAFGEWRRARSTCGGALVWFLRDLWPGAGWGVIDAAGRPKVAFHYLRRALQPVGLAFSDEGLSGLYVHLFNERPSPLLGELRIELFRRHEHRIQDVRVSVQLAARETSEHALASWLEGFIDLTRAFRFGPPAVDLVVGSLCDATGALLGQAFYFPLGLPSGWDVDIGLHADAHPLGNGDYELSIRTRRFAQSVAIDAGSYQPDDAYFHVAPGGERRVRLRAADSQAELRGTILAMNSDTPVAIDVHPGPG